MTPASYYILNLNLLGVTINTTQPVAPQTTEPPLVMVSVYVVCSVAWQHKTVDVDDFFCWCKGLTTVCIRGILIIIIKMAITCLKSNRNIFIGVLDRNFRINAAFYLSHFKNTLKYFFPIFLTFFSSLQ